jgi:hypothetical protein
MRDEPPKPETLSEFHERLLRESRALIARSNRLLEETADLVPPPVSGQPRPDQEGDGRDRSKAG